MSKPLLIMITGAAGFIGSRLSTYFKSCDYRVIDVVRSGVQKADNIILDLSDHDAVRGAIHDVRPDIVIHTAAITSKAVQATGDDYTSQNLDNSVALLNALADVQDEAYHPSLIFSSSVSVYGTQQNDAGIVSEGGALNPQSPYAQSKVDFENVLREQKAVRYAILRYSNIPGKDAFMTYVLRNKSATFFGDEPYIRDYIHLDDLCDLHGSVIQYFIDGGESLTLNAGSGVGLSFPDIVDEIERQTGETIMRQTQPPKENDVIRLICDMQRARDILNWSPKRTEIKDSVAYALENTEYDH